MSAEMSNQKRGLSRGVLLGKQKKRPQPDARRALRLVHEKGYRKAGKELGCPRSSLFDLREKYPFLYEGLDKPDIDDALLNLIPEPIHPAAHSQPLWSIEQLTARAEELVRTKKLSEPIQMINGNIVDGRNRRLLCLFSGTPPDFEEVQLPVGMTVDDYVELRNVLRRQLSSDQLAAYAAVRYAKMRDEGKMRRIANLRQASPPEVQKVANRGSSLEYLAQLYGVNRRYIQEAATIRDCDPKVFLRLRNGKITMADARRECGLMKPRAKKSPIKIEVTAEKDSTVFKKSPDSAAINPEGGGAVQSPLERPRLLSLAHGVETACRQIPDELKQHFREVLEMARQAIKDFEQGPH